MRFVLTYLRFHSNILKVVGMLILVVLAIGLVLLLQPAPRSVLPLGNTAAARPATGRTIPLAYDSNPIPRPIAPLLSTDARGVTTALLPSAEHQPPFLAALNCAREQAGLPALNEEPALSDEAASLWKAMVAEPHVKLSELVRDRFDVVTIVPLALAPVESLASTDIGDGVSGGACVMGGTDMTQLDLTGITTIGIAVFVDPRPEDGLDDSSAIIVAR